jgi:uncharacterized protein
VAYLPRIVDSELAAKLAANGAVVVEGPKACGKTETARQRAVSEVLLDIDTGALEAAAIEPGLVLDGGRPRLIDEWQLAPNLWNHVRRAVDDSETPGQFILTGSATPPDDATRHTGSFRFGRVRMRPMTMHETGHSAATISLAALLDGEDPQSADPGLSVEDLIGEVVRGGWPGLRSLSVANAATAVRDALEQIRRTDIQGVDGVRRDPKRVGAVMRSLARNVGTQAKFTKIAAEATEPGMKIVDDTVADYLAALERLFVVEDQPAWNPHLRSSHQLRVAPTRHFVDPSLAVAALGASPKGLARDLNFFGLLFESLVVRDLRVYSQALGGSVFHYRDNSDLEVDAILETPDAWAAFEVKLGAHRIEEGVENLDTLMKRVDVEKRGEPAVRGVIVGKGTYGYRRDDGICVIPFGSLCA